MRMLIDDLVAANRILYRRGVLDLRPRQRARPAQCRPFLMLGKSAQAGDRRDIMDSISTASPSRRTTGHLLRAVHSAEIYRARPDVYDGLIIRPRSSRSASRKCPSGADHGGVLNPGAVSNSQHRGMTDMLVRPALGKSLAEHRQECGCPAARARHAVVRPDIRRTVSRAIYTEVNARLQIQAMALGGPITYLAPEEIDKLERGRDAIKRGSGHAQDRTWEMWREEAGDRK
jgi:HCOMODA/2-hydroxy-3-carboxy-muconic semialdehyde decarboxylase